MKITDKYVPNLILSILLIFSLIGLAAAAYAKYYVLDENTFIENSDDNGIPGLTLEEIEKYFDDSEDYSGIPTEVYMSAIDEDNLKYLINLKIIEAFSVIEDEERMKPFDYSELENSITDYFNKFAEENNVEINDDYNKQLQKTIDTAKDEIDNFADIYMLEFMNEKNILIKVKNIYNYLDPIIYICTGLALLCGVLIAVVSRKKILFAFYWYSMSFICSSVLMMLPTLYVKISGIANRLIIRNECIYAAITSYISKVISYLIILETILLLIGIFFIALYIFASRKNKVQNKS